MINRFIGVGRLTKDPTITKTQNGKTKATFTLAISRNKEESDFIPCVAWNQTAELISQYIKKGNQIGVEGSIATRNYDDPNIPNKKVFVTEVLVNTLTFLESKKEAVTQDIPEVTKTMDITADDLPF